MDCAVPVQKAQLIESCTLAAYAPTDRPVSALRKCLRYPEWTNHCSWALLRLADTCQIWTDEQSLQIPDKLSSWKKMCLRKPYLLSVYAAISPPWLFLHISPDTSSSFWLQLPIFWFSASGALLSHLMINQVAHQIGKHSSCSRSMKWDPLLHVSCAGWVIQQFDVILCRTCSPQWSGASNLKLSHPKFKDRL